MFFLKKSTPYFHTTYLPHFLPILNNLIINFGYAKRVLHNLFELQREGGNKKKPWKKIEEDEHVGITKCHQQTLTPLLMYPIFSSFVIVYFKWSIWLWVCQLEIYINFLNSCDKGIIFLNSMFSNLQNVQSSTYLPY